MLKYQELIIKSNLMDKDNNILNPKVKSKSIIEDNQFSAEDQPYYSKEKQLSKDIEALLEYFHSIVEYEQQQIYKPLHVDSLASKFAVFYEKVRRVIDWKEEHLIRRTAIERSLKRRLISKLSGITFLQQVSPDAIAEPFTLELIRSGYFPNDHISASKIPAVRDALEKYLHVLSFGLTNDQVNPVDIKTKVQFYSWLLEIAACEIEEILAPPLREGGIINFMSKIISERIEIQCETEINKETIGLQTYIGVQKALFTLDSPIISYNIIKYKHPKWITAPKEILEEFTSNIQEIWNEVEQDLEYEHNSKFYNLCERYDAPYLILYDVLKAESSNGKNLSELTNLFSDWKSLERKSRDAYNSRISTLKLRLRRSAFYSTLSMFLAGGVMLIFVEGPLATAVYGSFSLLAMIVDLAIPSLLMFVLVSLINLPGKDNYKYLMEEFYKIVYEQDERIFYEIDLKKRRNFIKNLIFGFLYLVGTVLSFGFVFWIFKIAQVPWTSLYIDTANIAVVVFAALVIKQRSMEVTMEENVKFGEFILDIFSIPLANLGRWLSNKWKEYNFVSVFFTTVVDLPIVMVIELIEDWRGFLKDKKAGIH
ncbi:MAG: hypothetical protein PHT84_06690 [Candidatus Pacebacteria bacterium]|nr:hypothetical protein [Candidatus Paceibacterota bacterium]